MVDKKKLQVQFNKVPQEVLRDRRQREAQERMDRLKQPGVQPGVGQGGAAGRSSRRA